MRNGQILSLFLFISSIWAFSIGPKKPSQDDFYNAPDGFEDKPDGTILKIRKTPLPLRSLFVPVNVEGSWQILVRSQDSRGTPNAVVATIIKPYNSDPSKLLAYQTAEDSSSPDCAPSYAFQFGASERTITTEAEMLLIQPALNEGWYVVSPDYEGMKATFTAGIQSGQATLNSIRAALKSGSTTGVNSDAKVVMWGYSGGTIATGWASALQPKYAPELKKNLLGAAMGGWVTNITAIAESVEGTIFAGLTASAVGGLVNEYPELLKVLNDDILPNGKDLLNDVHQKCMLDSILDYLTYKYFSGPKKIFKNGWGLFSEPIVQEVINNNTIALHESGPIPDIPIFVYHGTKDTIVPFKDAQRGYTNWCKWGIKSFEFAVDLSAGHISEVWQGSPAGFAWIKKIFNGGQPVDGCTRTVRSTNSFYPGSVTSIGDLLYTTLHSFLQGKLGPNGEFLESSSGSSNSTVNAYLDS